MEVSTCLTHFFYHVSLLQWYVMVLEAAKCGAWVFLSHLYGHTNDISYRCQSLIQAKPTTNQQLNT